MHTPSAIAIEAFDGDRVPVYQMLTGSDEAFRAALIADRQRLLALYEAGLYAYRGERALWAKTLRPVLMEDPQNPY